MTCEIDDMPNRVQQHPCTEEATDRNWDWTKKQFDILSANIRALQDCFEEPVVSAIGVRRFKLTANLALGGSAAALLQKWVSGAWTDDPDGNPIVVKDVNGAPGFWMGAVDWGGWCLPEPGSSTNYHIIWMETIAKVIRYELTEPLLTTDASATVLDYAIGKSPGSTVDVYDPNAMYTYWHQYGCKGIAMWSDRNNRYEIATPQLAAKFLFGTLKDAQCWEVGEDPGALPDPILQIDTSAGPYKQAYYSKCPRNKTAPYDEKAEVPLENQTNHRALVGKKIVAVGKVDTVTNDLVYNMIDVEREEKDMITDIEWEAHGFGACSLVTTKIKVYVETCGEPEYDAINIPFTTKMIPESFEVVYATTPSESCKIIAHTGEHCVIRRGVGDDLVVAEMTKQEVMTDWYIGSSGSDYYIYGSSVDAWVTCVQSNSDTALHHLLRRDKITSFETTHVSDPPECSLEAHTKKEYVFRIPDPEVAGDDIEVCSMTRREVLIDASVDPTNGFQVFTEYVFVLCYDTGNTVDVIDATECP